MSPELAEQYSVKMLQLANQARGASRDINPKNELKILRLQTKNHEIIVSYGSSGIL